MQWWQGAAIYQIYPRSFYDSNGDGIGDLNGITAKLTYLASLQVDAIWISPFFLSPMKDFGYDVEDYREVDPIFGTLADFSNLLAEAHRLGLKIIIDQVISHTSDQHRWFRESRQDKSNAKADWYVWSDPNADGTPPNNWQSVFGGSAWQWDAVRSQYYLHNFLPSQPDLNFQHPEVRQQMLEEMQFWLNLGVDGFRLDTVNYYFHDPQLRDNPASEMFINKIINPYYCQQHIYDKNRPENAEFTKQLRNLTEQFPDCMLMGEIGDIQAEKLMAEYTGPEKLHTAYSFSMLTKEHGAAHFADVINRQQECLGEGWPTWAFSNHDVERVASRWKIDSVEDTSNLAEVYLALLVSLWGNICIYQGEELGLCEADIQYDDIQDPWGLTFWPEFKGRDGCRTPMPWLGTQKYAGFSDAKPWLPIPFQHEQRSVAEQEQQANSLLHKSRALLSLRKTSPALRHGDISHVQQDGDALWFFRQHAKQSFLCIFNFDVKPIRLSIEKLWEGVGLPMSGLPNSELTIQAISYQLIEVAKH